MNEELNERVEAIEIRLGMKRPEPIFFVDIPSSGKAHRVSFARSSEIYQTCGHKYYGPIGLYDKDGNEVEAFCEGVEE